MIILIFYIYLDKTCVAAVLETIGDELVTRALQTSSTCLPLIALREHSIITKRHLLALSR